MDKYTKAENTQKIFINKFLSFQIPYFPKRLILDKEEKILSLRLRDFLSKNRGEICEPLFINQEDPPREEGKQFQWREPSTSSSSSFANLIIEEVDGILSSDRHFLQVRVALLMPKSSDNQDNNNCVKKDN